MWPHTAVAEHMADYMSRWYLPVGGNSSGTCGLAQPFNMFVKLVFRLESEAPHLLLADMQILQWLFLSAPPDSIVHLSLRGIKRSLFFFYTQ